MPSRSRLLAIACGLFAVGLLLCLLSIVAAAFKSPLGYDESYNLQVVRHLAHDGAYASDGALYNGQPKLFDALISTGPTVLVPASGAVRLLGDDVWVARLVPVTFFVALVAAAGLLGRRIAGGYGGALAAGSVLAIDLRTDGLLGQQGSGDVLGEVPGALFLLLAVVLMVRRPLTAALLLGCAVLTKVVLILALPCFALALVLRPTGTYSHRLGAAMRFITVSAVPIAAWTGLQLSVLGYSQFVDRCAEFYTLFAVTNAPGQGRQGASRLTVLLAMPFWPMLVALILGALVAALLLLGGHGSTGLSEAIRTQLIAALTTSLIMQLWWWTTPGKTPGRYLLPSLFLMSATVFPWALLRLGNRAAEKDKIRRLGHASALALGAATLAGAAAHAVTAWFPQGPSLNAQLEVARSIQGLQIPTIVHVGWWQNSELSLLTGIPSHPLDVQGGVLVLSPVARAIDPRGQWAARARCDEDLIRQHGYVVCRVFPSSLTAGTGP